MGLLVNRCTSGRAVALVLAAVLAAGCATKDEPAATPSAQTMKAALLAACSAIDAPSLRGLEGSPKTTALADEIMRRVSNAELLAFFETTSSMDPRERRAALASLLAAHGLTECKSFELPGPAETAAAPPTPARVPAPPTDRATNPAFALREQGGMYVGRVDVQCPAGALAWPRSSLRKGFRLVDQRLEIELPHGGCPTWAGYTVVHGAGSPLPFHVCIELAHDRCELASNKTWVFESARAAGRERCHRGRVREPAALPVSAVARARSRARARRSRRAARHSLVLSSRFAASRTANV